MFDVLTDNPRRTALVLLLIFVVGMAYTLSVVDLILERNDGNVGALLDDTWIHVRFADHLAQGKGLSYNDSELTMGATSPLWVLALAAVYRVTDPGIMQQVDIAIVMSLTGYFLAGFAITGFGWWVTRRAWIGLMAGLITMLTGRFLWMGLAGMEITTFTALCIMALWSHVFDVRERRPFGWRTGILCALATLGRPEAYLLAALVGMDAFLIQPYRDYRHETGVDRSAFKRHIMAGWRGLVAYVLLAGWYPLTSLIVSGHPLPNTFRAKSMLGREWPDLPHAFFWAPNNEHGPVLIALAGVGLIALLWNARQNRNTDLIWSLWPVLFVLGVLFTGPERFVINNSRYVAPAIPFHALLAVIGIAAAYQLLVERWPTLRRVANYQAIPIALAAVLAIGVFFRGEDNAREAWRGVQQIRVMHIAVGEWIRANTAPDDLIALNDVGAIVHVSGREVLDLEGLVSPEVIEATRDTDDETCPHDLQLARLMLEERPAVVAVFPWFYPCLTGWDDALQAQTVYRITGRTVIAGGEMVIYRPVWDQWPMLPAVSDEATPVGTPFQEGITLAAYESHLVKNGLEVTLWWENEGVHAYDYHIFVHLIDRDGNIIDQHDSQPQNDRFRFSWWRPGDIIRDIHVIDFDDPGLAEQLNAADYQLQIGIYRFEDGTRLQRLDPNPPFPDLVRLPIFTSNAIFG